MKDAGSTPAPSAGFSVGVRGLRKVYAGGTVALDDVTLEVAGGEIVGLVGTNGAGKSTLVKVLSGVEQPTAGTISIGGRAVSAFDSPWESNEAGIGVVHQELPLFPNLTAAENLVVGLEGRGALAGRDVRGARRAYEQIATTLAGAPPADVPLRELALDQRQLVAVCRALSRGARAIVLDEPTSALPPSERRSLHDALLELRNRGLAILYVSHFVQDVLRMSDRVIALRDGRVQIAAQAASMKFEDVIEAMTGDARLAERSVHAGGGPSLRAQTPRLECRGLRGPGFGPIDLRVGEGELLGLYGLEGAGPEDALEAIYGIRPTRGTVTLDGAPLTGPSAARIAAGIAFVTGDRHRGVIGTWTLGDNVALPALATRKPLAWHRPGRGGRVAGGSRVAIKGTSASLMRDLSGGNQQRAVLARWLSDAPPKCLLLHEPTRGIDAAGKKVIHDELRAVARQAGTAVLLHSSDPEELTVLCDQAVVLARGRVVVTLDRSRLSVAALEKAAHDAAATRDAQSAGAVG